MKKQKGFLEKWTTETLTGKKYGCHVVSSNGKICETPGQLYSSRSGRRKWMNKVLKTSTLDLEERKINPPKK